MFFLKYNHVISKGEEMINLALWKEKKKELQLNYDKISEQSGVSKRTVEDIFRGFTKTPRIDTVEAIEKVLGISEDAMEWTEEDKIQGVGAHKVPLTAEDWEWMELGNEFARTMGKEQYNAIKNLLTTAVKNKENK